MNDLRALGSRLALPGVLLLLLTLSACDSSDTVDFDAVAGEYVFTRFEFNPASSLLQPLDVLDTLVTSNTRLQLFSSGRFTLMYQFVGGPAEFIGGDYTATSARVRLKGNADEKRFYEALLLSNEFTLNREGDNVLTADIEREVNLEQFSRRYEGLTAVKGTLSLRLQRQ
ncbi:hypothetical protein GQ464_007935 [Rhodocaloribacter litoris]|uniref:hypothetical protein n=1 Tax=Rhodocaloribacter litoris TaxID=2558931 RepID=UPI00141E3FCA|nr:hypothetical protein [Rhodocaloribacter litoris]QXD16856.1 hypothetical protein GQ464_007935 [Rhodocaloribacter litoris]GIV60486.1 MAG: hypothetical protein KatS3mg043_1575 [Rhodothermaceae bacterium]